MRSCSLFSSLGDSPWQRKWHDGDLLRSLGAGIGPLLTRDEELKLIRIAQKGFGKIAKLAKEVAERARGRGSETTNADMAVALAKVEELRETIKKDGWGALNKRDVKTLKIILEGENARNILTERNSRFVAHIAKRFIGRSPLFSYFDLIAEGNLGLMHAVELFKEEFGCRLSTYASLWIRQAIQRALSCYGRTISIPDKVANNVYRYQTIKCNPTNPSRQEIAKEMGMTIDEVKHLETIQLGILSLQALTGSEKSGLLSEMLVDERQLSPDASYEVDSLPAVFEEVLGTLKPQERKIIELRFGLNGHKPHTLRQIGGIIGVSKERVRQIEARILEILERNEIIKQYRLDEAP